MRRLLLLRFKLEFNKFARLALAQGVQVSNGIFMVVVIIGMSQNVDFLSPRLRNAEIEEFEDVPDISPLSHRFTYCIYQKQKGTTFRSPSTSQ